jgi:hypothetical protein
VEPASFFSASDIVRSRGDDKLGGGGGGVGEGPLTAGGKLARKRRCPDGRRGERRD